MIPFLILLMVGIIEFGYFFFVYSSVNMASREAARYGSGAGLNASGVPYYRDCAGIRDAAYRTGRFAGLQTGDVDITYDSGPGTASLGVCSSTIDPQLGQRIIVNVDVTYHPLVMRQLFPSGGIPIHSQSARTIIRALEIGN